MKLLLFLFLLLVGAGYQSNAQKTKTPFEKSNGKQSPGYFEIIDWWHKMDALSEKIKMKEMGSTDAGYPLHLVTICNQPFKSFKAVHTNKITILINNGIHPGEPDGIDASMLLARDIAENRLILPDNIVLAIIPVYNIGGCLNRSKYYRVDQNGPEAVGSRGNSQNLDLNRDFIKCDTREALAFSQIFHLVHPDIFVDTHVSNGADYQHVMTLLTTQHNKLGGAMGVYLHRVFEPGIYELMKKEGYDLIPYVNHFGDHVENGWSEFWDSPRYASGYAALFQTFSFVTETHMLKPYDQRVQATYTLLKNFIVFGSRHQQDLITVRKQGQDEIKYGTEFPVTFRLDSSNVSSFKFKGFKSTYKKSEISGLNRLYYDRKQPFTEQIPFHNQYVATQFTQAPKAYIIPQGWWKVIERLKANQVEMDQLKNDTLVEVETYYIRNFKSTAYPYQMHHANTNIQVDKKLEKRKYSKGDWLIPMTQLANRFLIETLEPYCEDSYFSWNFFDGILNEKEWYSDYHYEDLAAAYLKNNPLLQHQLQLKQQTDTIFAKSAEAQLTFIFNASPNKDPDFRRYPVARVLR